MPNCEQRGCWTVNACLYANEPSALEDAAFRTYKPHLAPEIPDKSHHVLWSSFPMLCDDRDDAMPTLERLMCACKLFFSITTPLAQITHGGEIVPMLFQSNL